MSKFVKHTWGYFAQLMMVIALGFSIALIVVTFAMARQNPSYFVGMVVGLFMFSASAANYRITKEIMDGER